jgi:ribosomal protein L17
MDVERIIQHANSFTTELAPHFKDLPNIGNYMMAYSSMLDLAIYRALISEMVDPGYATNLIGDINWQFVVNTGGYYRLKKKLIALKTKDPMTRMGIFLDEMVKFPYSKPGYRIELYKEGDVYHMNSYTCPVYDFYKQFGNEELALFRKVFCTYDYSAAERLIEGGRYQREHTLSDGDDVCDMVWFIAETPSS